MRTGDDDRNDDSLKEPAASLPEAPRRWPAVTEWLLIFGAPVVILGILWLFADSHVQKLRDGESATVVSVGNCFEGGGQAGPPPSCRGTWRFADGRSSSGDIRTSSAEDGDTVFAGEGWAYPSVRSVWSTVGILGFIAVATLAGNVAMWVTHFREDRQQRTYELRYPFEDGPETGRADPADPPEDRGREATRR